MGSLAEAHRSSPSVRCVPVSAPYDALFSVSYIGDNRRSDSVDQGRFRAQLGHSTLAKFDIHFLYVGLIVIKTVDLIFLFARVYS